ncbi:MAG: hypothetical protein IPK93_02825 [Solirubrobacterales bacterium]|nr:hypothetical protein [Solirubrobacterales bacterium]
MNARLIELTKRIALLTLAAVLAVLGASAVSASTAGAALEARIATDINPGPSPSGAREAVVVGEYMYFEADDGVNGSELWRSDGVNPEMVADINLGKKDSNPSRVLAVGDFVYFRAYDAAHGSELWRTDGTKTNLVHDIVRAPILRRPPPSFSWAMTSSSVRTTARMAASFGALTATRPRCLPISIPAAPTPHRTR